MGDESTGLKERTCTYWKNAIKNLSYFFKRLGVKRSTTQLKRFDKA